MFNNYEVVMKLPNSRSTIEHRRWCITRRGADRVAGKINARRSKQSKESAVVLDDYELRHSATYGELSDNFAPVGV